MYVTFSRRCVSSFVVSVELEEDAQISFGHISGVDQGEYRWTVLKEGVLACNRKSQEFRLQKVTCGSTWRIDIKSGAAKWTDLSITQDDTTKSAKRQEDDQGVSCEYNPASLYPAECTGASRGAKCIEDSGECGCETDFDCFGNTDYPVCVDGTCERCTILETGSGYADHYFCRTRYPGLLNHPRTGASLPNEAAAPENFFREVCVRSPVASSGACQRCNQAPSDPAFAHITNLGSRQGAQGTAFCNKIRPSTPICMDSRYFSDVNSPHYNENMRGSCVACKDNRECNIGIPLRPVCNENDGTCNPCTKNDDCSTLPGKNCQASGQCKSCLSDADCGASDGGEVTGQVSCNIATGVCGEAFQCTSNPSCVGNGGNNCQADKTCKTCTSNADCGALDGGEVSGQQVCDTTNGICGSCSQNSDCVGTSGNNCQADGTCRTCNSDADCGTLDGGENSGQEICNTNTGICEPRCTKNDDCDSKPGKNCQASGHCSSCSVDANCGVLDGGETSGQPICNSVSGICQSPCSNNANCTDKSGKNCQADGTCVSCASDADCGVRDGGENSGQTVCNTDLGLCVTPFTCTDNESCEGHGGANCQADGTCISCTRDTCGNLDGGEKDKQPNCELSSRLCVDACETNNDCAGTQGHNCQADGVCISCTRDQDCANDGGEVSGQTVCQTETGICIDPCEVNDDCPEGQNCQADGSCKACRSDNDCVFDGGEKEGEPVCRDGICTGCTSNSQCPLYRPTCGADGICFHCALAGCIGASAPNCLAETGLCVATCTLDEHCQDECNPYCNLEKGCCVECLENEHCPHQNWEGVRTSFEVCSALTDTCVAGCLHDVDCEDSEDGPACSPTESKCVGCLYDSHCEDDEDYPVCDSHQQICVASVHDGEESALGVVGVILGALALFFVVCLAVYLLVGKGTSPERV
eukprot:TRINITY_DN1433_c0_g1_i1.p1 TRINITY_DN1433_c0_g1~~TRINITY_DN1433_c0_g1_i1.p1  ORF type:complete len:928 (-),score=122.14 TRINITY_DN1433_c0_g1_i1:168-2951(-)